MGRRIASQSKQTVRGGPKPAKVGLHRRLHCSVISARASTGETQALFARGRMHARAEIALQ